MIGRSQCEDIAEVRNQIQRVKQKSLWCNRIMARKPRIEFPGGLYHIITNGNRREKVFDFLLDKIEEEPFLNPSQTA